MEAVPFTSGEPICVVCCSREFLETDKPLSVSRCAIEGLFGLAISEEMGGVRPRPGTGIAAVSGWLLEESPLRKGIKDERLCSFFISSADGTGGGSAFFFLLMTVPRRLFKPRLLGVSLVPKT